MKQVGKRGHNAHDYPLLKNLCRMAVTVILLCCIPMALSAQQVAENPGCPAGFGVDGDIYANIFENMSPDCETCNTDDWMDNLMTGCTGIGVIDEDSPLLPPGPDGQITENVTVCVRLDPTAVSLHDVEMFDALYVRDYYSPDGSGFQTTGAKNTENPVDWPAGASNIPPKDDIIDAFAHLREDGNGDLWFFGALALMTENGSHHADYEFFQKPIGVNEANDAWITEGENYGRTAWMINDIDHSGPIPVIDAVTGDILFSFDFANGGDILDDVTQNFALWMSEADYDILLPLGTVKFCSDCVPLTITEDFEKQSEATFGYMRVEIADPDDRANTIFTALNSSPTEVPRWGSWEHPTRATDFYDPIHFSEIGVDLSVFNIGFIEDDDDCTNELFSTLVIKSRSSFSFTATLKDYIKPTPFGGTDTALVVCETLNNVIDCNNTTVELCASITGPLDLSADLEIRWYTEDGLYIETGFCTIVEECGTYVARGYIVGTDCAFDSAYCVVTCDVEPPIVNVAAEDITCFEDGDGSVTATVSGGTPPFTYVWTWNGSPYPGSGPVLTNLEEGEYCVTVTGANGCYNSDCATVNEPPPLITQDLEASGFTCCPGPGTGEVCFNIRGGTPPYTVTANPGSMVVVNDGLSPVCFDGLSSNVDYDFDVLDANDCPADESYFISIQIDPPVPEVSQCCGDFNICCAGEETGFIHLIGGTACEGVLTYAWTGPGGFTATTANIDNLGAGTYCVVVSDDCSVLLEQCFELMEPEPVTCQIDALEFACDYNVSCNGAQDGEIAVTAFGGCPGYEYSLNGGLFQTSDVFTGLGAGSYTVTTMDQEGCIGTCEIVLTEPPLLTCIIIAEEYGCGYNTTCADANDGHFDALPDGGCPPYTFSVNGGPFVASDHFDALAPGTYTVITMDANGCTAECDITLIAPPPLDCVLEVTNGDCGQPGSGCFGEDDMTITVIGSGGCPDYEYSLNGEPFQSSNIFTGLGAGSYTVTTRDLNGCLATCTATLTEPPPVECELDAIVYGCGYNISCFGAQDGEVTVTAAGGCPPYEYSMDGGPLQTSNVFTGLGAGGHIVVTLDQNGCVAECDILLTEPPLLTCNIIAEEYGCGYNTTCADANDGHFDVLPDGGCPPYTFSVNGGPFVATDHFDALAPGSYTVTTMDANGCTAECEITLIAPPPLDCNIVAEEYGCGYNTTCADANDGHFDVLPDGGCPPYTFSVNGGPFVATDHFDALAPGSYTVTTMDANGCTAECEITLIAPPPLDCNIVAEEYGCGYNTTCADANDGHFDVLPDGGCPPYTFSVNGGPFVAADHFDALAPGTYTVITMDANGCTAECEITLIAPPPLDCNIVAEEYGCGYNTTCADANDGHFDVLPDGGCPPYSFSVNGGPFVAADHFDALAPGSYTVTTMDANGCTAECEITLIAPPPLTCDLDALEYECEHNVSCFGAEDGEIAVNPTGGCPPYLYSLNGGPAQPSNVFGGLGIGTYVVVIVDDNGCVAECFIELTGPDPLVCEIAEPVDDILCGSEDNALTGSATGGCEPYSYFWTVSSADDSWVITGGTNAATVTYTAGSQGVIALFTLVVTDANDCETICEIELECVGQDEYCTLTQGFYGNEGGRHCDGRTTTELITDLMSYGDIVLGDIAIGNSITFTAADVQCIIDRLPGGGPAKALNGNGTCADPGAAGVAIHGNSGRFRNVLLAQTLTLALNMRLDGNLAGVEVADSFIITLLSDGCGSEDTSSMPVMGSEDTIAVAYTAIGLTVADIFNMANDALAGLIPHSELRDISAAVGFINDEFDECRFLGGWLSDLPPVAVCRDITVPVEFDCLGYGTIDNGSYDPDGDEIITISLDPPGPYELGTTEVTLTAADQNGQSDECTATVTVIDPLFECLDSDRSAGRMIPIINAHPNPALDLVKFVFTVPQDGKASLEIINEHGRLMKVLFDGAVIAGTEYSMDLDVSSMNPGMYYYRLITDDKRTIKKLVVLN